MVSLGTPVWITIRAATRQLNTDISRGLGGSRRAVTRSGEDLGRSFTRGFNRGLDVSPFRRVANGIRSMIPDADAARDAFQKLVRAGHTLGTGLVVLLGGISSVVAALGSLIGAAGGAAATLAVLGNGFFALGAGMIAARLALGGVGGALNKLNNQTSTVAATSTRTAIQSVRDSQTRTNSTRRIEDAERSLARVIEANRDRITKANRDIAEAQSELTRAIREGREELQQLGFDAEDAALNEERAALQLEKARETLARVQDLPPNSRARREAELAYQEAELNYRKAKDANADLAAEQDRLAKTGVNGLDSVIRARERLADAEEKKAEVVKDALQDEEDALRDLAEARQKADDSGGGGSPGGAATIEPPTISGGGIGSSWDDGLNNAQREFVLFLNRMKPLVDELKNIASEAFLPKLQQAIQTLADKAFPTVANGIHIVANAMGNAAISLANIITQEQNLRKLNTLFESSGVIIELMGTSLGFVYDILLSILEGTAPMAEDFFKMINGNLEEFANYLNSVEGNKAMTTFFDKARYTAGLFGEILANVLGGIGGLIQANIGPGTGGDILLTWMRDATANLGTDGEDLKKFFIDVANNATKVLDAVGDLIGVFKDLGANQNIGKAFEVLSDPKGVQALSNILNKIADAGPSLANLMVTITKIVDQLTDTGAIEVFLDTLNGIATWFLEFVSDPSVKAVLDVVSRIFAAFLAVGTAMKLVTFGLKVVGGTIASIMGPFDLLYQGWERISGVFAPTGRTMDIVKKAAGGLRTAFSKLGSFISSMAAKVLPMLTNGLKALFAVMRANPLGVIITVISAVVAALVWFFTQTEVGKEMWANFVKTIREAWENISTFFSESVENIAAFFSGLWENISGTAIAVWDSITQFFTDTLDGISSFFSDTWSNITTGLEEAWSGISEFFSGLWDGVVSVFQTALDWVVDLFLNWTVFGFIISNWETISQFFQDTWANIQTAFDTAVAWIDKYVIQPFITAFENLGIGFGIVGDFFSDVWANIQSAFDVAVAWIDENVIQPFIASFEALGVAFGIIGDFFRDVWANIQSAFDAAVAWINQYVIQPFILYFQNMGTSFEIIGNFFRDIWNRIQSAFDTAVKWIDKYVIQPFVRAFNNMGAAFDAAGKFIGDVWTNIQNAIDTVWKWIDKNIFQPIRDALTVLSDAFEYAGMLIDQAWVGLQNALNRVWEWVDKNVFNPIRRAVDLVQQAFENTADGIAKAWEGIRAAAARPVNFVIETVYNKGIRRFWNNIAESLGMENLKMPEAKKVQFASGGVLPGYTPGRDVHRFYSPTAGHLLLSGGEAIMRPEWTRMMGGPAAIDRMNRAAMSGKPYIPGSTGGGGGGRTQRFAKGGILSFAGDLWDTLKDVGKIVADFFVDPKKAIETHLINGLIKPMISQRDDNKFMQLIGGVPISIAKNLGKAVVEFFKKNPANGPKGKGMGWEAMQQVVLANIPGAVITSGYRDPGLNAAVGGVNGSYHTQGRAIDIIPATMATFNAVKRLFPNASELIFSPAGSAQLLNGQPFSGWSDAVRAQHWDHVHLAMAEGGTVYPTPGGTIARIAEAGQPERVEPLDPNGLSVRDKALIDHLSGGGGGTTINVYQQPGEDGEALARRIDRIISRNMRLGSVG